MMTRALSRESHVGYYLIGEGVAQLHAQDSFPSLTDSARAGFLAQPSRRVLSARNRGPYIRNHVGDCACC